MANFDGMQFLLNDYEHECNYAFMWGYTLVVKQVKRIFESYRVEFTILTLVVLNHLLFVLSAYEITKISELLYPEKA